ncbi:hypothetical protein MNBD_ALPHA04-1380 [hydrothermal vent metagenome]|uniref:IraD/Gp25-like domain-containing protein n=1 Tax=hydrothermal vent metagenome TaxID=652676 RepID=A0A3B0RVD1_9ZZZZ
MSAPVFSSEKTTLPRPDLGWPLLPTPDASGMMHWPDLETSVRQMIEVILRTTPGEQLMRPQFGAGLEQLINKPNNVTTRSRLRETVASELRENERRIIVDQVDVAEDSDPNIVNVAIHYRHRNNGAPGSMRASVTVGAS